MLGIDPEKVCYVIVKAREFDVKEEPVEDDLGSSAVDDGMREILVDYADDPTYEELMSFLEALNQEELINLLALTWIGRGDFTKDDWEDALAEAEDVVDKKAPAYLIGIPLLSDYLELALSELGYSCRDYEMGRM